MQYPELSDAELVAHCRAGRQAAWSTLVRRFQRLVYTVPRRAGLDDDAVAEVFQHAFSRLFEQLDRLDDPARVRAWLVTTARRETLRLLDERRTEQQRRAAPAGEEEHDDPLLALPDPAPLPEALLAALQEQHRVRSALERLAPRHRQLLELLFLQDEPPPYAEIAARLGIPEGSIGPTRARALDQLRTVLRSM
ncbi:MAG: sigma-70 family RNA polymerase sigma factor [Piscinibacter sp.]|uniref:RNA polymerase sigma factor n=1 Tax=Piscinibacter TaxID=1114981 RepID=UPI0013E2A449|nr:MULTISPECIES: sigma-70 family RNA polymerase sigma factor [Piscinibacter]MCW5665322.1 sigma-70 family RNA polymerase sigma factor [Piscinibacter sp.]